MERIGRIGIEEIKRILPHREPFLMLDRVDEFEPGVRARAVKAVSANEWFFQGHFAETKVMPGVLIVEALAQTGGVALLTQETMRGKLALLEGSPTRASWNRWCREICWSWKRGSRRSTAASGWAPGSPPSTAARSRAAHWCSR